MSRSNPTNGMSNPCTRWFEWGGAIGQIEYYDKEKKETIRVPTPFTYLVLDVLCVIKGWHDPSQSGITSNEIRDTRTDILTVRSFKGGEIASGLYADIKDRVKAKGGHYTANCYIAYKDNGELKLGSIQFKGAALMAWMEFQKNNRKGIDTKAVKIAGFTEGKKGSIVYKMPDFQIVEINEDTEKDATALDRDLLQPYLEAYLKRPAGSGPNIKIEEEEEDDLDYSADDAFNRAQAPYINERKAFEAEEARLKSQGTGPLPLPDNEDDGFEADNVPF